VVVFCTGATTSAGAAVAVLLPFDNENDGPVQRLWPAFKQRTRKLGWVEGRNIKFDVRFTSQVSVLQP
jgi:hypothetical protein